MRQQLCNLIDTAGQPALVAECDLTILAANPAAKALLPSAVFADGLQVVLPGCNLAETARSLRAGQRQRLADPLLPGITIDLLPFGGSEEEDPVILALLGTEADKEPMGCGVPSQAMAAFSHTYRKPLSNMFGMLGVISSHLQANMDDSCDVYLHNLSQDCYQMLRSFSNLNELYRYYNGVYTNAAPEQPVDIWQLTHSLCESSRMMLGATGIPLTFDLPTLPALVLCDQNRYATAFSNLIANSCRFTREGNAIHVVGREVGSQVLITIADHGAGIPLDCQERVFEPFFSYDPEGAPFAGLGIGLPLARCFARSLGGSLALQSRELEGTTVALSLPRYEGDIQPIVCYDASQLITDHFSPVCVALSQVDRKPQ